MVSCERLVVRSTQVRFRVCRRCCDLVLIWRGLPKRIRSLPEYSLVAPTLTSYSTILQTYFIDSIWTAYRNLYKALDCVSLVCCYTVPIPYGTRPTTWASPACGLLPTFAAPYHSFNRGAFGGQPSHECLPFYHVSRDGVFSSFATGIECTATTSPASRTLSEED